MKKLLHERLREWVSSWLAIHEITEQEKTGDIYELFEEMADEIERYYIPRPRFEDGEPVQFGNEIGDARGKCEAISAFANGSIDVFTDNCLEPLVLLDGEFVKRPKPKVYDADGVEIKVGERLYSVRLGSLKQPIASIHTAGEVDKNGHKHDRAFVHYPEDFGNGKEWDYADNLTHKEPDSLEKLRDDIKASDVIFADCDVPMVREWADRLSALIERGA